MRTKLIALAAAGLFVLASGLHAADDIKDQKKAEKARIKAEKAQAKADREAIKYDEASYRRYVKEQNKEDKEWDKLQEKERDAYYKWLKKNKS
ncbi:hypothetical protein [Bryobacter aggregatus]|uniref:hypothetical protein n=1 Tax=Bryobacter aggregatus TaxID=360054 RepID=UPI0004E26E69|nr:hypothetical protein [Bryobacter aggregatus]